MLAQNSLNAAQSIQFGAVYGNYTMLGLLLLCLAAISLSAYVKIATVLGILRAGLGFASIPSAFVTGAVAIALSYCVMFPVIQDSSLAMNKVLRSQATVTDSVREKALASGIAHWTGFLSQHAHAEEVERFSQLAVQLAQSSGKDLQQGDDLPQVEAASVSNQLHVLAPAFLISELKEAFRIGLRIFLPFVVIDLLVSLLVTAIGLERQVSISIGFVSKLLLFVMCDGWSLIAGSLLSSYVT